MIWIPCDKQEPPKDGTYMVTTANGKIRFDRYVDGTWSLCVPRAKTHGRYRPHLAWSYMPESYQPKARHI